VLRFSELWVRHQRRESATRVYSPSLETRACRGLAILGLRQNGVLVTEAAVPATPVTQSGRIYAEVDGAVNTGVAIANVSDADTDARISFFFTDQNGNDFGNGSLTVGAKQQIAAFLNQSPFNVAAPVRGTFTFTSSLPISAVGFRGFTNELGEFLITTLPMGSITSASVENLNFPQFVDGGGWSTQVILVNPTSVSLTGTVRLYNTSGTESSPAGGMPYSIAPRSCFVLRTNDPEKPIEVKSVQV